MDALMLDSSFRWNDKAFKRYQYPRPLAVTVFL